MYRLTISGLKSKSQYTTFLREVVNAASVSKEPILEVSAKSHCLQVLKETPKGTWFRFYSFTEGDRPDVIDTESLTIRPNPLGDTETQLYWTHALLREEEGVYRMLIERNQSGIWPNAIQNYMQDLVDLPVARDVVKSHRANSSEAIVISLELEPAIEFIQAIQELDRIRSASLRITRPNPGWRDYENILGTQADESDAHYAQVAMVARRGSTLDKSKGIVQAIFQLFDLRLLSWAKVEGEQDNQPKSLSTEKITVSAYANLPIDPAGNVDDQASIPIFAENFEKLA